MLACGGEREAMAMAPSPTHGSAVSSCFHGCPAFHHRPVPPQSPPSPPLDSPLLNQQQPSPWDHFTIPKLHIPVRGVYVWGNDCLILIPFRLPQINCFPLSLKCFSSDSDSWPPVGIGPLLQFPHLPRTGPVLLTLLISPQVPSLYRVLRGSIYYFPLVRSSCLLSDGVLQARLCLRCILNVYVERDVHHIHLLLHHLVLCNSMISLKKLHMTGPTQQICFSVIQCTYNGILLRYKKEWNRAICDKMDEPRLLC